MCLLTLILGLVGCGANSGSDGVASDETLAENLATIAGNATKGPISGAEIVLIYFDEFGEEASIAAANPPVLTNPDGSYEFLLPLDDIPENIGSAIVRTVGGTMGPNNSPAPILESVVPDLSAAFSEEAQLGSHLSAASSVAAGLLKLDAQQSGARPSVAIARALIERVESQLQVNLDDDPNDEDSSTASLNTTFDELLALDTAPKNIAAVNEYIRFLGANLASASGRLDDSMQDPANPGIDTEATLARIGDGRLSELFPDGPGQLLQSVQTRPVSNSVDTIGPSIVSAIAISNTEVLVTFDEPIQIAGALNTDNYIMTAVFVEGQPTNSGRVAITQARFIGSDYLTILLTTQSQSDIRYLLQLTDLRDIAGNTFQVPEKGLEGLDPSTVVISGIGPVSEIIEDDNGDPVSLPLLDSDGDGISDSDELRGWEVITTTAAGNQSRYTVSSDPFNADTDGDGVTDNEEKHAAADPRSADTDGDTLTDNQEWNVIYSDPTNDDTDGDGTQDGFEFYSYRTSPVLADTDGDQISDTDEILGRNRDPRIADLPQAGITVGQVRLQIDERYTYTDELGNTATLESSSNSTLSQSSNTSYASSNTTVSENVIGVKVEGGVEGGGGGRGDKAVGGKFVNVEGSYQNTSSNTFSTSKASAVESQRVYERSLQKSDSISTTSTVSREVFGASIDVDLTIKNGGDLAFTITNLEITVLQRDRQSSNRFVPVATLIANSTLITGQSAEFNLGPFTPERGPILFSSNTVFPNLVEELMKAPNGLIFKVANFDMTDEFGRVFTYANQIARDRTAAIIVDVGDSREQAYLVATSLQPDSYGISNTSTADGLEYVGGFNADGSPRGIPLDFALQDTLGLSKNALEQDGIVAGPNRQADTFAQGDDIQMIPAFTTGVGVGSVVIAAGQNGVLDTDPQGDDVAEVTTGYETSRTCGPLADNAGDICSVDTDCTGFIDEAVCSGPEVLVRFEGYRNGDLGRTWVVLTNRELPAGADFGQVVLKPGADLYLAFVQDLDEDGLSAREEYLYGSTDSRSDQLDNASFGQRSGYELLPSAPGADGLADSKDTDRDGLGDFAEVRVGWSVAVGGGGLRKVFPNPRLADSDGDGLLDPLESDLREFCEPSGDSREDGVCALQSNAVDRADAIAIIAGDNGIADTEAENGDRQLVAVDTENLSFNTPVVGVGINERISTALAGDDLYESASSVPPATDPNLGDTDVDGVTDFAELVGFEVGLSIRSADGVADTQAIGDDVQRVFLGDPVKTGGIVILPGLNGEIDTGPVGDDYRSLAVEVVTDPLVRDTDTDTVSDGRELVLGSNPADSTDGDDFRDGDLDGLTDSEEADLGWLVSIDGLAGTLVKSNPSLPDSDFDGLPDLMERNIRTDPNNRDTDGDGLSDYDEFADFERFAELNGTYPRFFVDGSGSAQYGTDPRKKDTDGDGRDDDEELLEGYRILRAGEDVFRQVYTNPLVVDTDFDGRNDNQEWGLTDATDSDTDGDGRTDGQESVAGSDPLIPDRSVTISFRQVRANGGGTFIASPNEAYALSWQFFVSTSANPFPGVLVSEPSFLDSDIASTSDPAFLRQTNLNDVLTLLSPVLINVNPPRVAILNGDLINFLPQQRATINLKFGESFTVNGFLRSDDTVYRRICEIPFVNSYSYEEIESTTYQVVQQEFDSAACKLSLYYEIIVN